MRFLADESCDANISRALREAGHDVAEVGKLARRASDTAVIDRAVRDGRILLTEDKDFGELVYASGRSHGGVILLRYLFKARAAVIESVLRLAKHPAEQIAGCFVVVRPGQIRINRPPGKPPTEQT